MRRHIAGNYCRCVNNLPIIILPGNCIECGRFNCLVNLCNRSTINAYQIVQAKDFQTFRITDKRNRSRINLVYLVCLEIKSISIIFQRYCSILIRFACIGNVDILARQIIAKSLFNGNSINASYIIMIRMDTLQINGFTVIETTFIVRAAGNRLESVQNSLSCFVIDRNILNLNAGSLYRRISQRQNIGRCIERCRRTVELVIQKILEFMIVDFKVLIVLNVFLEIIQGHLTYIIIRNLNGFIVVSISRLHHRMNNILIIPWLSGAKSRHDRNVRRESACFFPFPGKNDLSRTCIVLPFDNIV